MKKFLCICFSATMQRTITFESLKLENVNRSKKYRLDASGKALNSARVLAQLEKDCATAFAPLGKKDYKDFLELAVEDGIKMQYLQIPGKTRECWTLLDSQAATTTELVVGEPAIQRLPDFIKNEEKLISTEIPKMIKEADAVLLAGSRPSGWSQNIYPQIAKEAQAQGKIFLADYIGDDLINTLKVSTPTIIKINDQEFCKTYNLQYPIEEEKLKEAIISQSRQLGNIIIITRGVKSTFASKNGEFVECPSEKVKALNTTACGDSFNSGFIYEYTNTGDFESALKKGTWCAARNAERECPGSII
ncbi:MAG: hypothetical protein K5866_03530 [Treponema sp.]|nr:hypothetical protein [Treponema sp.]